MENNNIRTFGEGGVTIIHPAVVVIFIAAGVYMFFTSKSKIATIFLILALILPINQKFVVAGLNVYSIRILILIGLSALLLTSKLSIEVTKLDWIIISWAVAKVVVFTLLWQVMPAFINMMGFLMTTLGIYFLFRATITSIEDFDNILKVLAIVSVVIAIFMLVEQITGRNLFSYLGGLSEFTPVRVGKLRAQGPFQHPICAGMFGATILPLFIVQLLRGQHSKFLWIVGIASALIIVITSSSSGPLIACMAGIAGLSIWRLRYRMRLLRWSALILVVTLHLVMKAPVWALIGRAGVMTGSTGFHRVELIDKFVKYFNEWWLLGTKDTSHWGYGMDDMINQFVAQGTQGGLLGLLLFILLITLCYKIIGQNLRTAWDRSEQLMTWGLGSSLFAHLVGFFGVSYWDQQLVVWYLLFAMIASLSSTSMEVVEIETFPINQLEGTNSTSEHQ